MNPMTNVKNVQKLNERELESGISTNASWHRQYKDSAWLFIGGLPYDLTEGDVIAVFSQYGEIVNLNLVRDKGTGKSKGFAFLCYEDKRSTILAVDNLNAIKLLGRTLRVDHCENYKPPKDTGEEDDITKALRTQGCGPDSELVPKKKITEDSPDSSSKKVKKHKKHKRKRHKSTDSDSSEQNVIIKKEKLDKKYDKYENKKQDRHQTHESRKHKSHDNRSKTKKSDKNR